MKITKDELTLVNDDALSKFYSGIKSQATRKEYGLDLADKHASGQKRWSTMILKSEIQSSPVEENS